MAAKPANAQATYAKVGAAPPIWTSDYPRFRIRPMFGCIPLGAVQTRSDGTFVVQPEYGMDWHGSGVGWS
jgi:hypothetical protein